MKGGAIYKNLLPDEIAPTTLRRRALLGAGWPPACCWPAATFRCATACSTNAWPNCRPSCATVRWCAQLGRASTRPRSWTRIAMSSATATRAAACGSTRAEQMWNPRGYVHRKIYINASCIDERPGKIDKSFVAAAAGAMPRHGQPASSVLLSPSTGRVTRPARRCARCRPTTCRDEYLAGAGGGASGAFRMGGIDPPLRPACAGPARRRRGARRARHQVAAVGAEHRPGQPALRPLLRQAGGAEPAADHACRRRAAVVGFGEHLGNPLRLRRPLDAGVRVVVAHCASLGDGEHRATALGREEPTSNYSAR